MESPGECLRRILWLDKVVGDLRVSTSGFKTQVFQVTIDSMVQHFLVAGEKKY